MDNIKQELVETKFAIGGLGLFSLGAFLGLKELGSHYPSFLDFAPSLSIMGVGFIGMLYQASENFRKELEENN